MNSITQEARKRPAVLLRLGKVLERRGTQREAQHASKLEQSQNHAYTRRKKSASISQRKAVRVNARRISKPFPSACGSGLRL